ncbi:GDP-mannose 4,6-dehydratase [Methanococcoides sp. SA1]|nr:GDP-mannose 4,6-dehydratase [Methanococcoides sp. SA1]
MENWEWNGKVALITGIGGQDGSYLAEFLLSMGYKVRGMVRRASSPNTSRIDHLDIYDDKYGKTPESPFFLLYGDLSDSASIRSILKKVVPDEIYNLGAQSHVGISFECPESTMNYNALGPLRILEAIRDMELDCKYYQASSSEMFGISSPPQNEDTTMLPQSPYGIAKLSAYHTTRLYRKAYGMFACNGILFNHESPRRGLNFVTKKITRSIADILVGNKDKITLGNLDAKRDWGFAKEYIEGMWRIVQHDTPDDFVIATRETHTVREFLDEAFKMFGLNWEDFVETSDKFKRPAEVPALLGDPTKSMKVLNWEPQTKFKELVKIMLAEDLKEKLEAKGLVPMEEEHPVDYYIEKGKMLVQELKRSKKEQKMDEVIRRLDRLKGDIPGEVIEGIKIQLENDKN